MCLCVCVCVCVCRLVRHRAPTGPNSSSRLLLPLALLQWLPSPEGMGWEEIQKRNTLLLSHVNALTSGSAERFRIFLVYGIKLSPHTIRASAIENSCRRRFVGGTLSSVALRGVVQSCLSRSHCSCKGRCMSLYGEGK